MNFWEQMILNTTLGVLSGLRRNPLNDPKVLTVIQHIVADGQQILAAAGQGQLQAQPAQLKA